MTRTLFSRENLGCFALFSIVALALLLLLFLWPAEADAQTLRHGVGWVSRAGSPVQFAQTGGISPPCNSTARNPLLRVQYDPWAACGDPDARKDWHQACAGLFFQRYDDPTPTGLCFFGGFGGAAPHGYTASSKLRDLFAAGKLGSPAAWSGVPNERELADVRNSKGEWSRLEAMWYALPTTPPPPPTVNPVDGWHRHPLVELPANLRPPLMEIRSQLSGPADGCAWKDPYRPRLWVRFNSAACFEGLTDPESCRSVAGLVANCWEVAPPEPPEPEPAAPLVELVSVECGSGESWVLTANAPGEDEMTITTVAPWPADVFYEGRHVFRFTPPGPCSLGGPPDPCPAAGVLEDVQALVCGAGGGP